MKKSLIAILGMACLFFSCSSGDDSPPKQPKEPAGFQLNSKIIGKWDVSEASTTTASTTRQSEEPPCHIYSLVFRTDKSFRINTSQGPVEGTYDVLSEEEISLESIGGLSEISFVNGGLSFYISLEGLCSLHLNCFHDPDYSPGGCSSFLHCNNRKIWKREENGVTTFVKFFDHWQGTWYRKFSGENTGSCYSVESNQLEEGTMVLVINKVKELEFLYEHYGQTDVYTYTLDDGDNLHLEVQTETGSSNQEFVPATQEELDELNDGPECGAKTYVPGDDFEQYLIDMGYDHVMDDYVLTENIYFVERVNIEGYYYPNLTDMTGLEDFRSLIFIQVFSDTLESIDLTGSPDLKTFYLNMPKLSSLDLTQNPKLENFLIEVPAFESLDLSQNPLLKGFEITGGSLKTIDLTANVNLEGFQIDNNPLEKVVIGNKPELTDLRLYGSGYQEGEFPNMPLADVDVTGLPALQLLHIDKSSITEIDLSQNPELWEVELLKNKLNKLDISANPKVRHFNAEGNDLECIQVAQVHMDRMPDYPEFWVKDESTDFSLDCGE